MLAPYCTSRARDQRYLIGLWRGGAGTRSQVRKPSRRSRHRHRHRHGHRVRCDEIAVRSRVATVSPFHFLARHAQFQSPAFTVITVITTRTLHPSARSGSAAGAGHGRSLQEESGQEHRNRIRIGIASIALFPLPPPSPHQTRGLHCPALRVADGDKYAVG